MHIVIKRVYEDRLIMGSKKWFLIFGLLAVVCIFTGCVERYSTDKVKDVVWEAVPAEEAPPQVQKLIQKSLTEYFRMTYADDNARYLLIGYGAQPTDGYSIEVEACYRSENAIIVNTLLKGPAGREHISRQESYPYLIMKIAPGDLPVVFQ